MNSIEGITGLQGECVCSQIHVDPPTIKYSTEENEEQNRTIQNPFESIASSDKARRDRPRYILDKRKQYDRAIVVEFSIFLIELMQQPKSQQIE